MNLDEIRKQKEHFANMEKELVRSSDRESFEAIKASEVYDDNGHIVSFEFYSSSRFYSSPLFGAFDNDNCKYVAVKYRPSEFNMAKYRITLIETAPEEED